MGTAVPAPKRPNGQTDGVKHEKGSGAGEENGFGCEHKRMCCGTARQVTTPPTGVLLLLLLSWVWVAFGVERTGAGLWATHRRDRSGGEMMSALQSDRANHLNTTEG